MGENPSPLVRQVSGSTAARVSQSQRVTVCGLIYAWHLKVLLALPEHCQAVITEQREEVKCTCALMEKEVLQVLHTTAYQENTVITENIYFSICFL